MLLHVYVSLYEDGLEAVNREPRRNFPGAVSPFIGRYFIFLHQAQDINPVKIQFRDHETPIKGQKPHTSGQSPWHEKVYLNPTILQRKWIDYKFKERFIPSVSYDTILPLEFDHPLLNPVDEPCTVHIRSTDKHYRNVIFSVRNESGEQVYQKVLRRVPLHTDIMVNLPIKQPGIHWMQVFTEDQTYRRGTIIFYRKRTVIDYEQRECGEYRTFLTLVEQRERKSRLFCALCHAPCSPAEPFLSEGYVHKNYIPIKEYLDIENLGMEYISSFIMRMNHPLSYRRGLIHLLNMLRLASIEDEITIITNLFRDDPPFAYFVTERLFLFSMIPIMEDRELQIILNRIDDTLLASALKDQDTKLVAKVMKNISRRRAAGVKGEMKLKQRHYDGSAARDEIHRIIKSHFEERFGRELRIPESTKLLYRETGLLEHFRAGTAEAIFNHDGRFIFFSGRDIYEILAPASSDLSVHSPEAKCIPYDVETFLTEIFTVYGMTETTTFLSSNFGIRYGLIHIYNWTDSYEDTERVENIGKRIIVPVKISTSSVILTIGVIDARGRPYEQVIRLKTKGGLA